MAKKKVTKSLSPYWRDWKLDQLKDEWNTLTVKAQVTKCERLSRMAFIYKTKLDFFFFGIPKTKTSRHLRPPLILFNKTLTNRYIEYSKLGYIFAKPKCNILN